MALVLAATVVLRTTTQREGWREDDLADTEGSDWDGAWRGTLRVVGGVRARAANCPRSIGSRYKGNADSEDDGNFRSVSEACAGSSLVRPPH